MKAPTRAWQRSGALIAGAAAGLIGVGLCAAPASAHTPKWSVTCSEVTVDLTAYNGRVENTVSITAGEKELLSGKTFGSEYHDKLTLPEHSSELTVHLVVEAGDGKQYSRDEEKVSPVCEGTPTASPSEEPTPEPSVPSKPSEKPTPEPSAPESASPSAVVADADSAPPKDLAETGSSSSTPIIAGAAAVVVVAGGGILLATRRRSAARN